MCIADDTGRRDNTQPIDVDAPDAIEGLSLTVSLLGMSTVPQGRRAPRPSDG